MAKTWKVAKSWLAAAGILILVACAGTGSNLVPGQSTAADVEKSMGKPQEKITNSAGESVWFYTSAPNGTSTRAARMRGDGTLVAVEERLTKETWSKIVPGKTTTKEARELLGPPGQITQSRLTNSDEWTYKVMNENRTHYLTLTLSADGSVVSKTLLVLDPIYTAGAA